MFCLEIWLGQGIVDSNVFNITLGIQSVLLRGKKKATNDILKMQKKKEGIFERHKIIILSGLFSCQNNGGLVSEYVNKQVKESPVFFIYCLLEFGDAFVGIFLTFLCDAVAGW